MTPRRRLLWALSALMLLWGSWTLMITLWLQPFHVPTTSMVPAIIPGDYVLVDHRAFRSVEPGVGEMIVFAPPFDEHGRFVKRIVGLGGDTVGMSGGHLYRNGHPIIEPYARPARTPDLAESAMRWQLPYLHSRVPPAAYRPTRDNWGPLVVPRGKLFVLGDNRGESADSRYWGFVDRESVVGRPTRVLWSRDTSSGQSRFRADRWYAPLH